MKLGELLRGITDENVADIEAGKVVSDSRKIEKGDVFVAYKGVAIDGHEFVQQAIDKGVVAIVGEKALKNLSVPYFRVKNGRLAWAEMIANWYGNPQRKLKIIGITGTDGKTTTTNLIYQILKYAGKKVSMTSTINAVIGDQYYDTGLHTSSPDPDKLWELLDKMVKNGDEYAVLEATSHGLAQERFGDIQFEIGVLTNLAHDHLEFHKTIDEYAKSKAKLFENSETSVLNKQSPYFEFFKDKAKNRVMSYDREVESKKPSYFSESSVFKQRFEIKYKDEWIEIVTPLLGDYNVDNILAASKVASTEGISKEDFKKGVEQMEGLRGRLEVVENKRGFSTIVDFAHTEQGLRSVLTLVKKYLAKDGQKIIVVFGCNGERDRSKRAPMGKAACELADAVVITTEDPRKENIDQIFSDIESGCLEASGERDKTYFRVDDRRQAINFAVNNLARARDFVLFLGKGHEQSMNINGTETPWDEVSEVKNILQTK